MRALAAALAILAAGSAGCAHVSGPERARLDAVAIDGQSFRIQYWPEDEKAARQVRAALALAVPRATRWGRLAAPVLVTIHPTHEALEAAAHREDHPWLRAWARYASIDLQSPRTWEPLDVLLGGPSDALVAEVLTHELTHCVMYQAVGGESPWTERDIPLWFREGLASVTAGQGYKRAGPEAAWRFYREVQGGGDGNPGPGDALAEVRAHGDPLTGPEWPQGGPLYQRDADLVYGTAHWAFRFLVDRYGEAPVRGILARMGRGQPFAEAFQAEIGIGARAFEDDFKRYLVWQGWRRGP